MRKITMRVCSAFKYGDKLRMGNTETDGTRLYLHGNLIAEKRGKNRDIWITNARWDTSTTNDRLNGLDGVSIYHKRGVLMLNDKPWDGYWIRVKDGARENEQERAEQDASGLKTIGMVAAMGSIFHAGDDKAANDWKVRMLKAGLDGKGLIMPEDWDTLSEGEKKRRLDDAIGALMK